MANPTAAAAKASATKASGARRSAGAACWYSRAIIGAVMRLPQGRSYRCLRLPVCGGDHDPLHAEQPRGDVEGQMLDSLHRTKRQLSFAGLPHLVERDAGSADAMRVQ